MISLIISILCLSAFICSIYCGNTSALSESAVDSCTKAVDLAIYLAGSMALWGGLLQIADKCGLTDKLARLLRPITRCLFKDVEPDSSAAKAITMNLAANMLGLGNAATPLGICAVRKLYLSNSRFSKRNIAMLVVLNSASIQLIPTTIGAIRQAHGAESPFDITPAILLTSIISAVAGCIMVYTLSINGGKK